MKLEMISLEHSFNPDNLITSHEIFARKVETVVDGSEYREQKTFADDSLFSKRIFGDMDTEEEYSCECGKLKGKFYDGKECDKCGTCVSFVGLNINKYGWIDLSLSTYDNGVLVSKGNGFHVIKYIMYSFLEKIIGRDKLKNIIHARSTITITGELDNTELDEIRNSDPKNKYLYIGLEQFYEKYDEVLSYYYGLMTKPDKKTYDFIKNRDEVFTDKIPVVSIILRPAMRTSEGLKLDDINIKYQAILKNLRIVRDSTVIPIVREATIEEVQAEYMMLSEKILENIKSKSGLIRSQICGTRINFSARNIISPAPAGIKIDELSVPYLTFMELYKFEIIGAIKEIENISYKEAELEWYNATLKLNEKIYLIIRKMISENEIGVLLNRNPTIAYGSIMYLRIVDVKHDINDVTMSLNSTILTLLAGDYDGDVLNLISIKDKATREILKDVFSPVNLLIDSNNGCFNTALNLERDQILGLNNLIN